MNAATAETLIDHIVRVRSDGRGCDTFATLVGVERDKAIIKPHGLGTTRRVPLSAIENSVKYNGHVQTIPDPPKPKAPPPAPARTVVPPPQPPAEPAKPAAAPDVATLLADAQQCTEEIRAAKALMDEAEARRKVIIARIKERRDELDAIAAALDSNV